MSLFGWLKKESPYAEPARDLYAAIVRQARLPAFYTAFGVPDTMDGRFDMVALHAFLVLHRLKRDHPGTADLAQALFDHMFADMEMNLREAGASDITVGSKVKGLAQGFYGRIAAYEAGLDAGVDAPDLADALRRNLYRKSEPEAARVAAMAAYVRREAGALAAQDTETLNRGAVTFGPPPDGGEGS